MTAFTPVHGLVGGVLIGLAAALLLAANGRTAGVSGIVSGLLRREPRDTSWRALFLLGLVLSGIAAVAWNPDMLGPSPRNVGVLALAGLFVGFGARTSGGCTSGHGVVGIARGSKRSIVATVTFVAAGMITVTIFRLLGAS
jgi:uncharacterized protein